LLRCIFYEVSVFTMATLLLIHVHPFLGALQPELLTTMQVFGLM
jgi:hypothetical protein